MKKIKIDFFKIICILTSLLFAYLFFTLLIDSESFLKGLGLESSVSTFFLARRASIFMLGISVLLLFAMNLSHSKARQIICLATGITMLGLSLTGIYEFINGSINSTIIPPIIIEIILGFSFLIVIFINRKKTS